MLNESNQLPLQVGLNVEARFETFYTGPNEALLAALKSLPVPGVWIAGEPASGRSHLLQAVVADHPSGAAIYLPLSTEMPPESIRGLPAGCVVCLDNIDAVAGDSAWERSLLLLYDQLLKSDGHLVASARQVAASCAYQLADLSSRLTALSGFHLRPLDDDGQFEALKRRAEARGLGLADDAARYMVQRLPRHLSLLFDWLNVLDHQSLAARRRLTLPFVRDVIRAVDGDLTRAQALSRDSA